MQLAELTSVQWVELSTLAAHLWIFAAALVITGLTYMLAHAMIPSLADTGELPAHIARRMRAPLYVIAVAGITTTIVVVVKFVILSLEVLPGLYPRLAI